MNSWFGRIKPKDYSNGKKQYCVFCLFEFKADEGILCSDCERKVKENIKRMEEDKYIIDETSETSHVI